MAKAGKKIRKSELSAVESSLRISFSQGMNITEACLVAGISRDTFYKKFPINERVYNEFEHLRQNPKVLAKRIVYKSLEEGDLRAAQYLLDRTSDEFKPKQELEQAIEHSIDLSNVPQSVLNELEQISDNQDSD